MCNLSKVISSSVISGLLAVGLIYTPKAKAIRAKNLRMPKSHFAAGDSKSIFAMDSQQEVREALKCAIGITGKGVPIKGVKKLCFKKNGGGL